MANLLTALRLLLVLPVARAIADPGFLPPTWLALMLAIAISTDYFDGRVARWRGTASPGGQLFDHATDFLFVTSGLAGAAFAGLVTPVLPALIVVAFFQYVIDSYFFYHQKQLRMSSLGRLNGILYFVPLLMIACARQPLPQPLPDWLPRIVFLFGWLLVLSTVLSILDRAMAPLRAHHHQS